MTPYFILINIYFFDKNVHFVCFLAVSAIGRKISISKIDF